MARQPIRVEGIRKLELPAARQAIPPLHTYLRECILDGTLTPGTKLSQVTLAEQLGVSRTPLREVLRMLQEEGLVEIEPNQRTRVAGLDPSELDHIYASRILLETLALSMTLHSFTAKDRREGKRLLTAMRRSARQGDLNTWFGEHAAFHQLITQGAQESLRKQLSTLADRTVRYIRIYQFSEPATWQNAGDKEHERILDALSEEDRPAALSELAHHLSRTALRVLQDCKPDYEPVSVPHAVELVTGRVDEKLSAAG
jgi:DNA-binding GntR family transcriptional regulator